MARARMARPSQIQDSLQFSALQTRGKVESTSTHQLITRWASYKPLKKNIPLALVALEKLLGGGKRLSYLCQDETRLGLKTETGGVSDYGSWC